MVINSYFITFFVGGLLQAQMAIEPTSPLRPNVHLRIKKASHKKYNKIKNVWHPNYEDSLQSIQTLKVIPGDKY